MEKLRENSPRYQALAIPRERFDRNDNFDPYKVKRGALSYRISDSMNMLARPKRPSSENDRMDHCVPQVPEFRTIESRGSDARILLSRGKDANKLTNRGRNQVDLDTYAQMVKRVPMPSRYDMPRVRKVQSIIEGGNISKAPKIRLKNHLNLDAYAQMVANNDKQCPSRIKNLAKPRKSYFDCDDFCMDAECDSFYDHLNGI